MGEPMWYNMIGRNGALQGIAEEPIPLYGFHKKRNQENELLVDGSARFLYAGKMIGSDDTAFGLDQANLSVVRRGGTWQLDTYPTPGAHVLGPQLPPQWLSGFNPAQWPIAGYQNNMTP